MKSNSSLSLTSSLFSVCLCFGVLLILPTAALGGIEPPPRVSYLEGTAAYESSGQVDWSEVTVNLPLLSGDRIFSHSASRVEVEVGNGSFLRLSGDTDVVFLQATGKDVILALIVGDVVLRVNDSTDFVVRLPNGDVEIKKKGLYRLTVDEKSGETRVIVRKGRADVNTQSVKEKIKEGQELVLKPALGGTSQILAASFPDDFELWSDRRDARYLQSASMGYVGGYAHGIYDLDVHGSWSNVHGYGWAWFPRVSIGWVPYRAGFWMSYPSWGLTWISYEPWGWLPYHYGRWVYHRPYSRWCWVPGASFSFSFWSPSVVDFYYGNGYVGWAPRGHGRGHTTVINDNSVTVVNNTVVNNWGRGSRGMTVVREGDFVGRDARRTHVEDPGNNLVSNLQPGLPAEGRSWAASRRGRGSSDAGGASVGASSVRQASAVSERSSGAVSNSQRTRSSSWVFGRENDAGGRGVVAAEGESVRRRSESERRSNVAGAGAAGRTRESAQTGTQIQNRNWNRLPSGVSESRARSNQDTRTEETRSRWQSYWNGNRTTGVTPPSGLSSQSRTSAFGTRGFSEASRGSSKSTVQGQTQRVSPGLSSVAPSPSRSSSVGSSPSRRSNRSTPTVRGTSGAVRSSRPSTYSAPRSVRPSGSTIRSRPSSIPSSRPSVRPSTPRSSPPSSSRPRSSSTSRPRKPSQ